MASYPWGYEWETRGNLLSEKVSPKPFQELEKELWQCYLVSRHFAYGKTLVYFAEDSR